MRFTKMNGLGNDYIYINTMEYRIQSPERLSVRLSDRHFGIGADGLVLIGRGEHADFKMRMFNPDGTESEMCGNAIRCVGKYVYERGLIHRTTVTVETGAGVKTLKLFLENGKVKNVKVNMGKASIGTESFGGIPNENYWGRDMQVVDRVFRIYCASIGNPHCVIFVDDLRGGDIMLYGQVISENTQLFEQRTNVEFVKIEDKKRLSMRVYERGTGETMACGTGAAASFFVADRLGLIESPVAILLRGGILAAERDERENIFITGTAEINYEGEIFL